METSEQSLRDGKGLKLMDIDRSTWADRCGGVSSKAKMLVIFAIFLSLFSQRPPRRDSKARLSQYSEHVWRKP